MKRIKDFSSLVWELLDGKKTYIGSIIVFIAGGLKALGKIDEKTFDILMSLGGAVAVYGIRDAIRKIE